jgi:hypothetical protein
LFAIGAEAGTRISFDVVRGAGSTDVVPDEEWVDGASAGDLHTRLLALADERAAPSRSRSPADRARPFGSRSDGEGIRWS